MSNSGKETVSFPELMTINSLYQLARPSTPDAVQTKILVKGGD
jgi:hypothetical protein